MPADLYIYYNDWKLKLLLKITKKQAPPYGHALLNTALQFHRVNFPTGQAKFK